VKVEHGLEATLYCILSGDERRIYTHLIQSKNEFAGQQ